MAGAIRKGDELCIIGALGVQRSITRNLALGSHFSHLHHPASPQDLSNVEQCMASCGNMQAGLAEVAMLCRLK